MPFLKPITCACLLIMGACTASAPSRSASSEVRHEGTKEHRLGQTKDECLASIRRARRDAREGRYHLYVDGRGRYKEDFARFLRSRMKALYGIDLIIYDGAIHERDQCYGNEMDKIIYHTFGASILADAEQEARVLFEKK